MEWLRSTHFRNIKIINLTRCMCVCVLCSQLWYNAIIIIEMRFYVHVCKWLMTFGFMELLSWTGRFKFSAVINMAFFPDFLGETRTELEMEVLNKINFNSLSFSIAFLKIALNVQHHMLPLFQRTTCERCKSHFIAFSKSMKNIENFFNLGWLAEDYLL